MQTDRRRMERHIALVAAAGLIYLFHYTMHPPTLDGLFVVGAVGSVALSEYIRNRNQHPRRREAIWFNESRNDLKIELRILIFIVITVAVPPVPAPRADKVAKGEVLYARYCAECHGADLKGSPTWKEPLADGSLPPPPHDDSGHTWHHPDRQLIEIIQNGGDPNYNSKMPAFGDRLSEDEVVSIPEFLKSKWSVEAREFQWWISARPE
jgi:mono/diheme cytochrome c family protein